MGLYLDFEVYRVLILIFVFIVRRLFIIRGCICFSIKLIFFFIVVSFFEFLEDKRIEVKVRVGKRE